jgi:hypothetical protein
VSLKGLYRTIEQLAHTASSSPPAADGDDEARRHAAWHRRIARAGYCGAPLGLALGVALSCFFLKYGGQGAKKPWGPILLVPPAFAIAGFAFGVSLACAVAPRSFLAGPAGRRWMKLIGTKSVAAARAACVLLALGLAALAAFIVTGLVLLKVI